MKINNIITFIFHFFIFFYIFFLFYWQSKNYKTNLYFIPYILKIGIPLSIKELCYQDIYGEFSGSIINLLDLIFIKKLNMNIEYVYIQDTNDYFDCILSISEKSFNNQNILIHSEFILDVIPLLEIKKKNTNKKKIVTIKNDLLYYLHNSTDEYLFVDSIAEAITYLELKNEYVLLISQSYYNYFNDGIIQKNYRLEDYTINIIQKKIKPVNLLFNYRLYWLLDFFNKIILQLRRNTNELQSIKYI